MSDIADQIEINRLNALVERLGKERDRDSLIIAREFKRAEAAEAEVERLKGVLYEALNSEEDRMDYDCKCQDCKLTLSGIGDTLRSALEAKP